MASTPRVESVFAPGNVALITGAGSGIGLAAARRFAALGMTLVMVDLEGAALDRAAAEVAELASSDVLAAATDVSQSEQVLRLRDEVARRFGVISVLMNNAGVGSNPGLPWENESGWKSLVDVNLWGVIHGVQAFVPSMIAGQKPGMIINTGSKQGITSPPGNAAYNLSKAALKNYTESLAHALRELPAPDLSAHLLIPGYTFTGMTQASEKPEAAWSPEQVIDFLLERLGHGDFYVLCPDNAVDRRTDELRMQWSIDDLILNRPALSRWHPDYEASFARYLADARRS